MEAETPAPGEALQGRFEGRQQFQQWLRGAVVCAGDEGWRELVLSDADFADWPLGERQFCEALTAWARPGRKLVLLACGFDELQRRHARFVAWRVQWSHLVACLAVRRAEPLGFPSAVWSPHWALRRLDVERCTGYAGREPQRRNDIREALDAPWQRATPAFPASVLGL